MLKQEKNILPKENKEAKKVKPRTHLGFAFLSSWRRT
jgi:hypothetical protein